MSMDCEKRVMFALTITNKQTNNININDISSMYNTLAKTNLPLDTGTVHKYFKASDLYSSAKTFTQSIAMISGRIKKQRYPKHCL